MDKKVGRRRFQQNKGQVYLVNHQIRAAEVRVIDVKGKQLGIMSLSQALREAQNQDLDLVEVAPKAKPSVVRIVDFTKFRYEQEKKDREARKKARRSEIKDVWLTPTIGKHDLKARLEKISKFLKGGNQVKLAVRFYGRHLAHKERGEELMQKALDQISEFGQLAGGKKWKGPVLEATLRPTK